MIRSTQMKEADDADCTWVVDDVEDDENDDDIYMFTDAQYFVREAESESEESESAGVEVSQDILAKSEFNVVSGNEEIADEAENGPIYRSALASPPKRQNSTSAPTSADPWAAGPDPRRRSISTEFAD